MPRHIMALLRVSRRKLLISAPAILLSSRAEAFPLRGAGGTVGGDALATLLAGMSVGQWKRISGPVGNIVNFGLPFTRANFDAYGTGAFGTFSSGNSIGTRNAANMTSFSKGAINVSRQCIVLGGGGHVACEDGSFYRFDILGNCADVNNNVTPRGWTVAAKTGLLTPITDPQPASSHDFGTPTYVTATGNGSSGSANITLSGTSGSVGVGNMVSIAGQTPSTIPAGSNIGSIAGSVVTLASPNTLQGTLTKASLRFYASGNYWSGASTTGQSMPTASHTYASFVWVPGTSKLATGGNFGHFDGFAQPGAYVYDDSQPDGSNVVYGGSQGKGYADDRALAPCPGDPNPSLYRWDSNSANLVRFDGPWPGGSNTTLKTGLTLSPAEFFEGVIIPDPVKAGKWAYFAHINCQTTSGGFAMILNMFPAAGATYSNQPGTYRPTNPSAFGWQNNGTGLGDAWAYNSDLGMPVCYGVNTTNGQIQKVTINSSLDAVVSNVFASPSGDIPPGGGSPRLAYDNVHKCYILQKMGDVFVSRAA